MPPLETHDLVHKAILWEANGQNRHGKPKVSPPVEIDCRWVSSRKESIDVEGNPIAIDAKVVVDRDIAEGSVLLRGELADYDAGSLRNKYMVVVFSEETDDIKGRETRRSVALSRFGSSLPEIVS